MLEITNPAQAHDVTNAFVCLNDIKSSQQSSEELS